MTTVDFERSFKTEELRRNKSEEALFSDKKKTEDVLFHFSSPGLPTGKKGGLSDYETAVRKVEENSGGYEDLIEFDLEEVSASNKHSIHD